MRLFPVSPLAVACLLFLASCAPIAVEREVKGQDYEHEQLIQSDSNRVANLIMRDNMDSLETLLYKLYRRNPSMWRKRNTEDIDSAVKQVMTAIREETPLSEPGDVGGINSIEAIRLALTPSFEGDRAGTYIYGLGTMLIEAYNGHYQLAIIHGLDPQKLANAAHNVMVAAWLLTDRKNADGHPLLLSNEISADGRNLSFEREHGKIIGRLDTLAAINDEKYRRSFIGYAQNWVAAPLLQLIPIDSITAAVQ